MVVKRCASFVYVVAAIAASVSGATAQSGGGTVSAGTAGQLAFYSATGTVVTGTSTIPTGVQSAITQVGTIGSGVWNGSTIGVAYGGTGATSLTGLVKGNGTSGFTAAVAGTDYQLPLSAATPTASVGLAVIAGTASTYMRSDAAPALSQAIAPTWTGTHVFSNGTYSAVFTGGPVGIGVSNPSGAPLIVRKTSAGADAVQLGLSNASTNAGTGVILDLDPTGNGVGVRSSQIVAETNGSNQTNLLFRISNAATPTTQMAISSAGLVTLANSPLSVAVSTEVITAAWVKQFFPGLSTSVAATFATGPGLSFVDTNDHFVIKANVNAAEGDGNGAIYVEKNTNYSGMPYASVTPTALYVNANIGNGILGGQLAGYFQIANSNTTGSQPSGLSSAAALATQGNCSVVGCVATWGAVLVGRDSSNQINPVNPLYGLEVDNYAVGSDNNGTRIGVQIVAGTPYATTLAPNVVTHGLFFTTNQGQGKFVNMIDGGNAAFHFGILLNGNQIDSDGGAIYTPGFFVDPIGNTIAKSLTTPDGYGYQFQDSTGNFSYLAHGAQIVYNGSTYFDSYTGNNDWYWRNGGAPQTQMYLSNAGSLIISGGLKILGVATTGAASGSLCIDSTGNVYKKMTSGSCI